VLGIVTWLSLVPKHGLPQEEWIHVLAWIHHVTGCPVDKIVHTGMYFVMCGSLLIALPNYVSRVRGCVVAFLFAVFWGVLMEFAQASATALGWTARSFDYYDMLANGIGAILALASFCTLRKIFRLIRN
jgi:VanZ family protein